MVSVMYTTSSDPSFARALETLCDGFPVFAEREFERARNALSPPLPSDLACAIVSDSVLALSALGIGAVRRGPAMQCAKSITSILAALQSGRTSAAETMVRDLINDCRPAHMLPLQVLARRLTIAGVRVRILMPLHAIPGGRASSEPPSSVSGAPRLKLVSSK